MCMSVWVWVCECKNSILSTRESQTVENCIRNVSTDLRLSSLLIVLTLVCLSCSCRTNLRFVLSVFHILKEMLMLYFLLHVPLKLTSCLLEWVYTRVDEAFLLFECYEILVALKKPRKQVGLHVSCDRHCSFFLFVWALFLLSPHSFPYFTVESWFECNTEKFGI